ncbi:hypothetical protein [Burkholderia sp. LA-2-3-30-S1-D2]|uniref:hypothetical protein n=1 Tax=Burkholderia sp. LA-2-3-30-S1-D2 TaxID=1637862 RepID=UPI000752B22E|nr:hypothetical protein [Burkholderia sp. LA-2-3-30-S1-D2]AOI94819.1 hypothetical protein WS66_03705 [Burkholderia sp. LA-2-3-30-S1-D2]KVE19976.1 hypothetical protein WS66_01645 [Burkholderia sp. LA-2-3-30-S1-D2]
MTRRSSPFEVCGLKPIRQDSEGPLFDPAEAATMIANSINADTNYFQRKTKDMNTDFAKAESATCDAIALFERSLARMVDAEKQVAASTKKAAGSVRKSANELGDTMQRLLKTADIDRLERYATVLERMAAAMQTLATLEIDGKLDRIVSAIR